MEQGERMKKLITLLFLLSPSLCLAGDGSGILPHWNKTSTNKSMIYITNISDSTVTVFITLYDESGSEYTESSETGTNLVSLGSLTGDPLSTSGATLDANESGIFKIERLGASKYGYGVITWSTSGKETVALIVHNQVGYWDTSLLNPAFVSYPVNDHRPF